MSKSIRQPSEFIGKPVYAIYSRVNIRETPSVDAKLVFFETKDKVVGTVEKFKAVKGKTASSYWYYVRGIKNGWIMASNVYGIFYKPADVQKTSDGRLMMEATIKQDAEVFKKLLTNAELIERLKNTGKDTLAFEKQLAAINKRFTTRQEDIKNSKLVNFSTGVESTFSSLAKKFSGMISGPHVGIIPLIPIAVIFCIGLASAAALYAYFKPKYSESTVDFKASAELEKALESVAPEQKQAILKDIEGQVDKAYNQGQTDGQFDLLGGGIKNLGILALGGFAAYKIMQAMGGRR